VFRGKQHPEEREAVAREAFLITLAVKSNVASSTQNPAPNAIVFLYRQTVRKRFGWLEGIESAKKPAGLPVLCTRDEERAVLARLTRGPMRGGEPLVRLRISPHGVRRLRVRASIRNKTSFSNSRFDFELPLAERSPGSGMPTRAPRILGDRGGCSGGSTPPLLTG